MQQVIQHLNVNVGLRRKPMGAQASKRLAQVCRAEGLQVSGARNPA